MDGTEIRDSDNWESHFIWDEEHELYKGIVEWSEGVTVEIWIHSNGARDNTAIKHALSIFNSLKDREDHFKCLAAQDLIDSYIEHFFMKPINKQGFIDSLDICLVRIWPDGESIIEYITPVGLLVVITVSSYLKYEQALFD